MFIQFDSSLLEEFEDIIKDDNVQEVTKPGNESDDDEETIIPILDANSLTLKDLLHEMERRGLHPRGFFADDAKVLQAEVMKEHNEYKESKLREKREARELEASQRLLQRRKCLTEIALREEKEEMQNNQRINEWCCLIKYEKVPLNCRIEANSISARLIARLLWSDTRIISLDMSNLNLSDTAGAYIARMLKNNRTLAKLELGENALGCDTFNTLAESLKVNNVLEYLSMESNPLTSKDGASCIEALSNILQHNKSLRHFSLWRCNTGVEGGRLISEAMRSNETMISMEMGYNHWQHSDVIAIKNILSQNKAIRLNQIASKNEVMRVEKEIQEAARKHQEEEENKIKDKEWLEDQKIERTEERRKEMLRLDKQKMIREKDRQKEMEFKMLEEERNKQNSKCKKKKKKGKKKK